jgi:hypothetical protein
MTRWRVEVDETINQSSVYIIDAKIQKQAERIAKTEDGGNMERLSYYTEERKANKILSIEEYPYKFIAADSSDSNHN